MKKIVICLLMCLITLLTACDDINTYKENNPELQVIATNSLLGVFGGDFDKVSKLEEDDYGRTLFVFEGEVDDGIVLAVLISQKNTSEKSYYYDNTNYIICKIEYAEYLKPLNLDLVKKHFTDNEIQELKDDNDWNTELKEDKFFEIEITRKKHEIISEKKQKQVFENLTKTKDYDAAYSTPLTTDKKGKTIYFMTQHSYDSKTDMDYWGKSYLVMFDSSGEVIDDTGTQEIQDRWNYLNDLKEFKEANGWSFYSK